MADLPANPPLSYGTSRTKEYRTNRVVYGDDYSTRVGKGKNSRRQRWSLTWNDIKTADRAILEAFFDGLAGTTAFTWQPPGSATALKFVAVSVSDQPTGHEVWNYRVEVEQVFDP